MKPIREPKLKIVTEKKPGEPERIIIGPVVMPGLGPAYLAKVSQCLDKLRSLGLNDEADIVQVVVVDLQDALERIAQYQKDARFM